MFSVTPNKTDSQAREPEFVLPKPLRENENKVPLIKTMSESPDNGDKFEIRLVESFPKFVYYKLNIVGKQNPLSRAFAITTLSRYFQNFIKKINLNESSL